MCECLRIPRIMPAKSVTYNSQNYAGTLGSGLNESYWFLAEKYNINISIQIAVT